MGSQVVSQKQDAFSDAPRELPFSELMSQTEPALTAQPAAMGQPPAIISPDAMVTPPASLPVVIPTEGFRSAADILPASSDGRVEMDLSEKGTSIQVLPRGDSDVNATPATETLAPDFPEPPEVSDSPPLPNPQSDALPIVSTDALPIVSTDALPIVSTDALPIVSTDALPIPATDALPIVSTDALPIVSTDALPIPATDDPSPSPASNHSPPVESGALPGTEADVESDTASPSESAPGSEPVTVETASFKGVTPGTTTIAEASAEWGEPISQGTRGTAISYLYKIEPFEDVELNVMNEVVTSIVVRLRKSYPASTVATELDLKAIEPVLVSNALGHILGQAFPERGVLFSFLPAEAPGQATMKVDQVILEPVTAEPFVLRAETQLENDFRRTLTDLDTALSLDPNHDRAHWLRARSLMALGDDRAALGAAAMASGLQPDNAQYRVTRAETLRRTGQVGAGISQIEEALKLSPGRPHVHARALCVMGDLLSSGNLPNYQQALSYHTEAIKAADPILADKHPALRLAAKEVMVDAHLGAARDIAWGRWDAKDTAVTSWLSQAAKHARNLVEAEHADPRIRFRVAAQALAVHAGLKGSLEPKEWVDAAIDSTDLIVAEDTDGVRAKQAQWELGVALYDAVQVYQMRREYPQALEAGQRAILALETGAETRDDNPADVYLVGRLYFRLGAIHAMGDKQSHAQAAAWYDRARPILQGVWNQLNLRETGRVGETFVSIGVSYWNVGRREEAVKITEQGIELVRRAVSAGLLEQQTLEIPYSNLASMYGEMGDAAQAEAVVRQATRARNGTLLQ